MSVTRPQVVVAGAGFGGISVVRALARAPVKVTLIDRNNYHLFQPLLYQVATAVLDPSNISSPIRAMLHRQRNVDVLMAEVDGIDTVARTVSVSGAGHIPYDQLVVATGSATSWFGRDDWSAHSIGLKTLEDAERLRLRLLRAFEVAESNADDADEVRRRLTFVVVGGGPSGVELAGSIRVLARDTLRRDFRRVDTATARVLLFEGGAAVLAGYPERLRRYARDQLERMAVEVHTGVQVEQVDGQGIVAGGERFDSSNVFWCAGVAASPAAAWIGAAPGPRGTVEVGPDCSLPGHPDIFAIGDVASVVGADGKRLPGVAPVAQQQGEYVARVIAARATGAAVSKPFRYTDRGSMAIIGRSAAVASLPHVKLTGTPAWILWAGVHLLLLNGLGNRAMVYLRWMWTWLFHTRGSRLIDGAAAGAMRPPHHAREGAKT